jgi:hypothetical protein
MSRLTLGSRAPKCVVSRSLVLSYRFGISEATMLVCAVRYRAVLRGWFAIWFATPFKAQCLFTPLKRTNSMRTFRSASTQDGHGRPGEGRRARGLTSRKHRRSYLSVASASGALNCRIRKVVEKVECLKTLFRTSTVLHGLNQLVVEALVRKENGAFGFHSRNRRVDIAR